MKRLLSTSLLLLLASATHAQFHFESSLVHKVNCLSTTYGFSDAERERLKSCACETVVAAYDAQVEFADLILQAVNIPNREAALEKGFKFYLQSETGKCRSSSNPFVEFLTCTAQTAAFVGDLANSLLTRPWTKPYKQIRQLCSTCYDILDANRCDLQRQEGGGGGGSGFQIYCIDKATKKILKTIWTSGGGGGGGGDPTQIGGGGGGAGQALIASSTNPPSCGGGCGNGGDTICPAKKELRYDLERHLQAAGTTSRIVFDEGNECGTTRYANAIASVQSAVEQCSNAAGSEVAITSGGGNGGGITDLRTNKLKYSFSVGFSFDFGPRVFIEDGGDSGQDSKASCGFPFAQALCDKAGFTDEATVYALCQCPVAKLYDPKTFNYDCPTISSPSKGSSKGPKGRKAITAEDIEDHCETYCPRRVESYSGYKCPDLDICASCRSSKSSKGPKSAKSKSPKGSKAPKAKKGSKVPIRKKLR